MIRRAVTAGTATTGSASASKQSRCVVAHSMSIESKVTVSSSTTFVAAARIERGHPIIHGKGVAQPPRPHRCASGVFSLPLQ